MVNSQRKHSVILYVYLQDPHDVPVIFLVLVQFDHSNVVNVSGSAADLTGLI